MREKLVRLVLVVSLCCCALVAARAQNITAGIRGTVTDSTGAVVAEANVTVIDNNTSASRAMDTNAKGEYDFELLPVSTYKLVVERPGFKTYEQTGILLAVNQIAGINVVLVVGRVNETVQVSGQTLSVNTQTSEISTMIGGEEVKELPLNGRNPIQLALLTNGVSAVTVPSYLGGGYTLSNTIDAQGAVLNVNGNRADATQFNLDGGEFAGISYDSGLNYPNPDALEEFRFITSNYDAEFGRLPGGVMNVITKSGTNEIHGSGWEFNRNDVFKARAYFEPTLPFLNQNQYGFTLGGPVVKDKLFLFGTYQNLHIAQQETSTGNFPPTTAERTGDLSADPGSIIDPETSQPFPGNIIPTNRIDPIAAKLLTLVPLPNQTGGTLFQLGSAPVLNHQYLIKGDYQITNSNRLSASIFRDYTAKQQPFFNGGTGGGFQYVNGTGPNYADNGGQISSVIANDTHIFTPHLLNHARFGYNLIHATNGQTATVGPLMSQLSPGYPTFPLQEPPSIWISGRVFGARNGWGSDDSDEYQFSDGVDYVKGKHTLKFGGDIRSATITQVSSENNGGIFWGNGSVTGNALADFMLGVPEGILSNDVVQANRQRSWSVFTQDDYRIHRNLTLNLGMRYQVAPPWLSLPVNKLSDGTLTRGLEAWNAGEQSQLFSNAPQGIVYSGDPGVPNNGGPTDWTNVAPRLGLAWDVFGNGKTSVRGGFGLFYQNQAQRFAAQEGFPFGLENFVQSTISSFAGFPPAGIFPVPAATRDVKFPLPVSLAGNGTPLVRDKNAQVTQYNLTIEHQLARAVILSAAYVGNEGRYLTWQQLLDPAVYIPGTDPEGNPLSTEANTDARRTFNLALPPGSPVTYSQITQPNDSAHSNYNSFQLQVRTQSYHGLTLQGAFTWQKTIDESSLIILTFASNDTQDSNDLRNNRGVADFDNATQAAVSFVYKTPDVSETVFRTHSAVVRGVFDNWETSGVTTLTDGSPFSVTTDTDNSRTANGQDRADIVANPHLSSRSINEWFNTAAFVPNQIGQFGDTGRNILRGPSFFNTDLGFFKNFPLWSEKRNFQLRLEMFNAFNHTNFGTPGNQVGTPGFGQILTTAGDGRIVQLGGKITF